MSRSAECGSSSISRIGEPGSAWSTTPPSAGAGACDSAAAGWIGIVNPKVLPTPTSLVTHIRPPCSSTIRFDERQPEAGALGASAGIAPAALERLEDPLLLALGDPDAGVA